MQEFGVDAASDITGLMSALVNYAWKADGMVGTDAMPDNTDVREYLKDAGSEYVEQGNMAAYAQDIYGPGTTIRFDGWCDETGAFYEKEREEPLRPVECELQAQRWNLYAAYTVLVPGLDGTMEEIPCVPCILDGKVSLGFLRLERTYMLGLPAENYIILPQNTPYKMNWTKDGAVLPTDTITIRGSTINRYGLTITLI